LITEYLIANFDTSVLGLLSTIAARTDTSDFIKKSIINGPWNSDFLSLDRYVLGKVARVNMGKEVGQDIETTSSTERQ
jgi:hypothetical protein